MQPPLHLREGQRFLMIGEEIGLVRFVKTRHDVYGGITKPPKLLRKGQEINYPWAKLRRVTPYTLLLVSVLLAYRRLRPLVQRFLLGTI